MKKLLYFIIFVSTINSYGLQRILYVDGFIDILGNKAEENELLTLASENNFKSLILYDLDKIDKKLFHLADSTKNNVLINFIKKAKTVYKIKEIGASGENGGFFINEIDVYNKTRKDPLERFDVYNLEYEYWKTTYSDLGGYYCETYLRKNGIPCTREGGYKYYLETLSIMNCLAEESDTPIKVEAYIGKYQNKEIKHITNNVDRLLISSYESSPKKAFKNIKNRLDIFFKNNAKIELSIILSSEVRYMGGFLKYKSLDEAENELLSYLNIDQNKLNFIGFTYYNYSYLKKSLDFFNFRKTGVRR